MDTSMDNSKEQLVLFNPTDTTHQTLVRCLQQQYFRYWRQLLSMVGLKTDFGQWVLFRTISKSFVFIMMEARQDNFLVLTANHITQYFRGENMYKTEIPCLQQARY